MDLLMELRKCCNHAYLFDSAQEASSAAGAVSRDAQLQLLVGASGKLELLHLLLASELQVALELLQPPH